jgi:hypothetical protein
MVSGPIHLIVVFMEVLLRSLPAMLIAELAAPIRPHPAAGVPLHGAMRQSPTPGKVSWQRSEGSRRMFSARPDASGQRFVQKESRRYSLTLLKGNFWRSGNRSGSSDIAKHKIWC